MAYAAGVIHLGSKRSLGLLGAACAAKWRVSAAAPTGVRACALCWARV